MAGAQQQQQGPDNSSAILWGALFAFGLIGLAWFVLHDHIVLFVLKVRWIEARCLGLVLPKFRLWADQLQLLAPQHLHFSDLVTLSETVGYYLRFLVSTVLVGFAIIIYLSRANVQFNQYYSMETFAASEVKNWAQITPVVQLNLVDVPIDEGSWAMALTPFQFAEANDLLDLKQRPVTTRATVMTMDIQSMQINLKRQSAQRVLSSQLGDSWQGVDALPMPLKALFVIFAARGVRDRNVSDQLLTQIAQSAASSSHVKKEGQLILNFTGVETLVQQYETHPLVIPVIQKHEYTLGVMASMLVLARKNGVLASAEFIWLKPYDRRLWFMLNCIGRQTAYAEIAGPFSHWVAEKAVGCKLRVPMVEMAVDALELSLKEVRFSQ